MSSLRIVITIHVLIFFSIDKNFKLVYSKCVQGFEITPSERVWDQVGEETSLGYCQVDMFLIETMGKSTIISRTLGY